MRTSNNIKSTIQVGQVSVVRDSLKEYIGHNVDVVETTGNQKYTHYQGKFLSISTNLFTIETMLGKTNKSIKSFPINDILIEKLSINKLD